MTDECEALGNVLNHVQEAFPGAEVKWIVADDTDVARCVVRLKTYELDYRYLGFTSEAIDHHGEDMIAHMEAHEWRERLSERKQVLLGDNGWRRERFMDRG